MCSKVGYPLLTPPPLKKRKTSLKKLKPPRSGRNINICVVEKNVITIIGVPAKNFQGGGADQIVGDGNYTPECEHKLSNVTHTLSEHFSILVVMACPDSRPKIPPPPPTYGENGLYVERKDCPHRKIPPKGNPPPTWNCFIHCSMPPPPPPGRRILFPPYVRRS